jgi:hypothetical protein
VTHGGAVCAAPFVHTTPGEATVRKSSSSISRASVLLRQPARAHPLPRTASTPSDLTASKAGVALIDCLDRGDLDGVALLFSRMEDAGIRTLDFKGQVLIDGCLEGLAGLLSAQPPFLGHGFDTLDLSHALLGQLAPLFTALVARQGGPIVSLNLSGARVAGVDDDGCNAWLALGEAELHGLADVVWASPGLRVLALNGQPNLSEAAHRQRGDKNRFGRSAMAALTEALGQSEVITLALQDCDLGRADFHWLNAQTLRERERERARGGLGAREGLQCIDLRGNPGLFGAGPPSLGMDRLLDLLATLVDNTSLRELFLPENAIEALKDDAAVDTVVFTLLQARHMPLVTMEPFSSSTLSRFDLLKAALAQRIGPLLVSTANTDHRVWPGAGSTEPSWIESLLVESEALQASMARLGGRVERRDGIVRLDFSHQRLGPDQMAHITQTLKRLGTVGALRFAFVFDHAVVNGLTLLFDVLKAGLLQVCELSLMNTRLPCADLGRKARPVRLRDADLLDIAQVIEACPGLHSLNLFGQTHLSSRRAMRDGEEPPYPTMTMYRMARALGRGTVRELDLGNCRLTAADLRCLVDEVLDPKEAPKPGHTLPSAGVDRGLRTLFLFGRNKGALAHVLDPKGDFFRRLNRNRSLHSLSLPLPARDLFLRHPFRIELPDNRTLRYLSPLSNLHTSERPVPALADLQRTLDQNREAVLGRG